MLSEQSTDCSEDGPKRLILDLMGPFVVHFHNDVARIHAPLCVDHHANILTDTDDISLDGLPTPAPADGHHGRNPIHLLLRGPKRPRW